MAHELHLKLVRKGAESINSFRKNNPDIEIDLQNAELQNVDLTDANLSDADLRFADLRHANLTGANLSGAKLSQADLGDANLTNAMMMKACLSDANLRDANFTGANLAGADLRNTNLRDAIPFNFDADDSPCIRTLVRPEDFPGLHDANLEGLDLSNLSLNGIRLPGAMLNGVNLTDTDLCSASITSAILENAKLSRANLFEAILQCTNLRGADLSSAKLVHTDLSRADISEANLLGANLDSTTNLGGIQCYQSTVDRSTAEYLRSSGASLGQLMDLKIEDDLATLRAEFGGLWGAIHCISVLVFLLPYAWFLGQQSLASKAHENAESVFSSMEGWAKKRTDHIMFVSAEAFKNGADSKIERTAKEWRDQLSLNRLPEIASTVVETNLYTAEAWAKSQSDHIVFVSADSFKTAVDSKIQRTAKEWRELLKLKQPREISVLTALFRYIWNGGKQWREGYFFNAWSFFPFVCVAAYNALRLTLLVKTKKLDTRESVRKLPVVFSLGAGWKSWRTVYRANQIGYGVALLLILCNTFCFLLSPIQI